MQIPSSILDPIVHASGTPLAKDLFRLLQFECEHFEALYGSEGAAEFRGYYKGVRSHAAVRQRYWTERTREVFASAARQDLLEIGCAFGTEAIILGLQANRVVGRDISQQYINVAERRRQTWGSVSRVEFQCADGRTDASTEQFSLVYIQEALHHIFEPGQFLDSMFKQLRPGGIIVISEPNGSNPLLRFQLRRAGHTGAVTMVNGFPQLDEQVMSAKTEAILLKAAGFLIKTTRYFRVFPDPALPRISQLLARADQAVEHLPLVRTFACVGYNLTAQKPF